MSAFPVTQHSLVEALRSDNRVVRERAMALAVQVYRAPIVAVAAHRWNLQPADAEDLAHDFLMQALAKNWFARYDATRGKFRTFLRACLVAFAATRAEAAGRQKRGGHRVHVSLDAIDVASPDAELDALFDREWVRSVFTASLEALRTECTGANRAVTFAVFVAHDIDGAEAMTPPTYATTAHRFDLPATQVANYLHWARQRFRHHVLNTLRALTTSDAEFRDEAKALLGVNLT